MKKMKKQAIAMALGTTFMLTTVAPVIQAQNWQPHSLFRIKREKE